MLSVIESALCEHTGEPSKATDSDKGTCARIVLLARRVRHRALNLSPTIGSQRRRQPGLSSVLAGSSELSKPTRFPFTAAHIHRVPKPPRSSHPPKSVLVTRCSPSHSFLLCCLSINAAFTNTQRVIPFIPFAPRRNQGVNPKLHSGPDCPQPQRAAFRIQQSRASLSESTAPQLSTGLVFLATPRHWVEDTNNPLYPIPALSTAVIHPPRTARSLFTTAIRTVPLSEATCSASSTPSSASLKVRSDRQRARRDVADAQCSLYERLV